MFDFSSNWKQFKEERTKALGVWPCQLWRNGNAGALVVMKSPTYDEYALSKVGLDYQLSAQQAGRLARLMSSWPTGKPAS